MAKIIAKPTRSTGVNTAPVNATAEMVANTGSLVPSIVARIAPIRITPDIYSQ